MNFKADVLKNLLLLIAFDSSSPIDERLFKTSGLLRRQFEAFGDMARRQYNWIFGIIDFLRFSLRTSHNLREFATITAE